MSQNQDLLLNHSKSAISQETPKLYYWINENTQREKHRKYSETALSQLYVRWVGQVGIAGG